ncbi:MAG: DUF3306 domain-containing protein [Hyphomicrobiales bacterium]
MSDPEKFLDRWSRRKRDAADEPAPVAAKDATAAPLPPDAGANAPAAEVPFDPASLPPIESISANSDIRAFLQPGLPPDLSRAALRRAWSTDPAIRDFIGLVENGWNFNDPDGIPGFGPINAGDVAQLLARVIGAPPEEPRPQQVARVQDNSEQDPSPASDSEPARQSPQDQPASNQDLAALEKDSVQRNEDDVAAQYNSDDRENFPPSRPRGHGGALPK